MASSKRSTKGNGSSATSNSKQALLEPFGRPPEVLEDFTRGLSRRHVYITHIDSHPAAFKRKMFMVPVAMNVVFTLFFLARMYGILPWYWNLIRSGFGHPNETSFRTTGATWTAIGWEVARRGGTMFIDFLLFVFIWPWPLRFVVGDTYGSPAVWRWHVGFRDKEIYVRRSREWHALLKDILKDQGSQKILLTAVSEATKSLVQDNKTGYLLMNAQWDLDWNAMVHAHAMVNKKDVSLQAFQTMVLVHHRDHGWLRYDVKAGTSSDEEARRREVFHFRDALVAMGKEDLFYRWVEMVQFEATQPGGFGPKKQESTAQRIRELFESQGVNFDELWKESNAEKSDRAAVSEG